MALTFSGAVPVPAAQTAGLTVLVTGASRGIGYELVVQYAKAHADNVVFAGVRDPSAASVKPLTSLSNVHVVQLDVSDERSVRASVSQVERHASQLDVLINNAAIIGAKEDMSPVTVSAAAFTSIMMTNVTGVLMTTQAYLPLLRKSTAPKVINVSSAVAAHRFANAMGFPMTAYGTSKAALNYLTTAFRYGEPKVTFVTAHPGWVQTDMGNNAGSPPTRTEDSVQALRYYIAQKTLDNSGEFFDAMTGDNIAQ